MKPPCPLYVFQKNGCDRRRSTSASVSPTGGAFKLQCLRQQSPTRSDHAPTFCAFETRTSPECRSHRRATRWNGGVAVEFSSSVFLLVVVGYVIDGSSLYVLSIRLPHRSRLPRVSRRNRQPISAAEDSPSTNDPAADDGDGSPDAAAGRGAFTAV